MLTLVRGAACCLLLAACYLPSMRTSSSATPYYLVLATCHVLRTTYCLQPLLSLLHVLLTTYCSLLTTYYLLLTTYYLLITAYYLLPTIYYLPQVLTSSTRQSSRASSTQWWSTGYAPSSTTRIPPDTRHLAPASP